MNHYTTHDATLQLFSIARNIPLLYTASGTVLERCAIRRSSVR